MIDRPDMPRLDCGLPALDAILCGGFPKGSMTVLAGRPGAGKTILAQQVCFHHGSPARRALYFNTRSEPTAKTLRYVGQFAFFDAAKLEASVQFIDLGGVVGTGGLDQVAEHIMTHVERVRPALVVVDSYKVLDELARSEEDLRKFGYEIAVRLMVWECTSLLLGGYGGPELASNPLFSVVDGLVLLTERRSAGKRRRFLRVVKMRGTDHSSDAHPFVITRNGVEILAPRAREGVRGAR